MVDAWTAQVAAVTGGRVLRRDGLVAAMTRVADPSRNVVLAEGSPRNPDDAVAAMDEVFREAGLPVGFDLCDGADPQLEGALRSAGLRPLLSRPAMYVDVGAMNAGRWADAPSGGAVGRAVERVRTDRDLEDLCRLETEVFGSAPEIARALLSQRTIQSPQFTGLVARVDRRAVAMASAWTNSDTMGIFGVATAAGARRRGHGRALTARLLAMARARGLGGAWLQSTEAGLDLYRSLGFERVGTWTVWTRR